MTDKEKIIKYLAIAIAILLIAGIIGGIASAIGAIFGVKTAVGETKTYDIEGEIISLEVEISAADFRIEAGDSFRVESNLKNLTFRQTGNRLILKEKSFGSRSYNDAFITIYIPEGAVFGEIDVFTGAGKFTAESLYADKIDFEFGAAEVNITELVATREADIEGGAGEITIGGGRLRNLQLDMGVGSLNLTSRIVGEGEFNLGVGDARITLIGGRDSYTVEINRGVGEIRFDGEIVSSGRVFGSGKSDVEINGGIGSVAVGFK